MFKTSLINPPERILGQGVTHYLPFPLLYLAAYLEDNNFSVDIIDIKIINKGLHRIIDQFNLIFKKQSVIKERLYSCIIDKIVKETVFSSPDLIGISCMTREYNSVMKIASILKTKLGIPIVVGGIHPSLYPEQFIYDKSPVDFVVIGEGEETLLELARCLESRKGDYRNIDGIAYLKDRKCYLTEKRTLKDDFLISPIKVYHKLNMQFYTSLHQCVLRYIRICGTQIFTSRGCPYKCSFCSNSLIWKMNKRYKPIRYRPISSVIEEIKFLKNKYQIDSFYIMDDTFCIEKRRVEEFCGELKNAGINLVWGIETRSNLVDEALLKKMKNAGLVQLDIGVESGSNEMLREINKEITVEDTLNIFSLAHKYKIRTFANFMINLPNETWEQLQETIHLMDKIRPSGGAIAVTVPLPKTELFNKYVVPKIKNEWEVVELLVERDSNYYKVTDDRLHLAKYNIDFEDLINRLTFKYFMFVDLELRSWYWKVFFKSKRKIEYIFAIIHSFIEVTKRIIVATIYQYQRKGPDLEKRSF